MRKRFIMLIFMTITILGLYGCMTEEEKQELNQVTKEGLVYIEEKYGEDFSVRDSGYVLTDTTLFPTYSDDIEISLEDGTDILYRAEENKFYDDYQAEEICEALEEEIFNPMMEQLKPYYTEPTTNDIIPNFNYFNEEGCHGNFFHTYYDGDIKEFATIEKPGVGHGYFHENGEWISANIYLIAEDSDDWQDRFDIVKETREKYFDGPLGGELVFVALTQELYEQEVAGAEKHFVNIGMEGCWATGTVNRLWVQNYIKIADGIYVTSSENNFILEEGDITLKEVMGPDELQQIMDVEAQKQKEATEENEAYRYVINAVTSIYELEFSQRIMDKCEASENVSSMGLYIKFAPEELEILPENILYEYSIRENKHMDIKSREIIQGNSEYAEWHSVNVCNESRKDYYWIGNQTEEIVLQETGEEEKNE